MANTYIGKKTWDEDEAFRFLYSMKYFSPDEQKVMTKEIISAIEYLSSIETAEDDCYVIEFIDKSIIKLIEEGGEL